MRSRSRTQITDADFLADAAARGQPDIERQDLSGDCRSKCALPARVGVSLPALATGKYQVQWSALSPDDGHVAKGVFSFAILGPVTAPARSAPATSRSTPAPASSVAGAAKAALRDVSPSASGMRRR